MRILLGRVWVRKQVSEQEEDEEEGDDDDDDDEITLCHQACGWGLKKEERRGKKCDEGNVRSRQSGGGRGYRMTHSWRKLRTDGGGEEACSPPFHCRLLSNLPVDGHPQIPPPHPRVRPPPLPPLQPMSCPVKSLCNHPHQIRGRRALRSVLKINHTFGF